MLIEKNGLKIIIVEATKQLAGFKTVKFAFKPRFWNIVLKGDNLSVTNAIRLIDDGLVTGGILW